MASKNLESVKSELQVVKARIATLRKELGVLEEKEHALELAVKTAAAAPASAKVGATLHRTRDGHNAAPCAKAVWVWRRRSIGEKSTASNSRSASRDKEGVPGRAGIRAPAKLQT
jgi:hypothetical protein